MTDQPTNSGPHSDVPSDPTAPPPPPAPAYPEPPVEPTYAAPTTPIPESPSPPPAHPYGSPTQPPAAPSYGGAPQQAPAHPYGAPPQPPVAPTYGYNQAPSMGAQGGGQVAVGSLPYVEHHFGPVASFGDRVLPSIIDGLITVVGIIPLVAGIIVMASSGTTSGYDEYGNYQPGGPSGAGVGIGLLLMFFGFALALGIWIWNRIFRMGRTGQSVGKKMSGLKLINATTGQPIGPGQSFVRELIHGLANQVVYLSYLWMLWDPNRQTLGDMVAKSTVIKVPKA